MSEEITEEVVLRVIRFMYWKKYVGHSRYMEKALGDTDSRELFIQFFDGYQSPGNRTAFFAVGGSPNKVTGYIEKYQDGIALYTAREAGAISRSRSLDVNKELLEESMRRTQALQENAANVQN